MPRDGDFDKESGMKGEAVKLSPKRETSARHASGSLGTVTTKYVRGNENLRTSSGKYCLSPAIWKSSGNIYLYHFRMETHVTTPHFELLNAIPGQENSTKNFTLQTPPKTDIFASPTIGYHFSAPIVYVTLPIREFHSAAATITVPYTLSLLNTAGVNNPTLQFDQGGLVFALLEKDSPIPTKEAPGGKDDHPRWIKAGVEIWEGKAWGSIVVREKWSDWSLFDVEKNAVVGGYELRLQMEKLGDALVIFALGGDGGKEKTLVRKVPWVFLEEEIEDVDKMWVGVYGARPDPFDEAKGRNLEIGVEGFEVWNLKGERVG